MRAYIILYYAMRLLVSASVYSIFAHTLHLTIHVCVFVVSVSVVRLVVLQSTLVVPRVHRAH